MFRYSVSTPFPGRREMDEGSLRLPSSASTPRKGICFEVGNRRVIDAASTRRRYGCRINGRAALNIK
jgi:hypothetical protein